MPQSLQRIVFVFLLAVLLPFQPALASKCPFISYTVEGDVVFPEGTEPGDIKIVFFLEGSSRTSDYPPPAEAVSDYTSPDKAGHFKITSHYSTESESGRGCRRIATQGDLVFVGEGVFSVIKRVSFLKRTRRERTAGRSEEVGVVRLQKFHVE